MIFITGFPGFLGSALLPRLLERAPQATAVCLVQPRFADLARTRVAELSRNHPALAGRIQLVEGDITAADLGLGGRGDALAQEVEEIYHLAAVYDLSVPRAVGMRVNVDGTRHVLDFAQRCTRLRRLHYVSTCYVSGAHAGVFHEHELSVGQHFHNFYEETKYLAEADVRARMEAGLPATIYRPAIVVGDSHTGETQKYDGPYFGIRLLLRQPKLAVLPVVGDVRLFEFNIVPRNFVIDAITYLSNLPAAVGKTYHLADPRPLTVDGVFREIARATGRTVIRVPMPLGLARWSLNEVPGVQRLIQTPADALDYQVHPTHYDTANAARDLADSGISCPPFASYVDRLVAFTRANPDLGSAAMV